MNAPSQLIGQLNDVFIILRSRRERIKLIEKNAIDYYVRNQSAVCSWFPHLYMCNILCIHCTVHIIAQTLLTQINGTRMDANTQTNIRNSCAFTYVCVYTRVCCSFRLAIVSLLVMLVLVIYSFTLVKLYIACLFSFGRFIHLHKAPNRIQSICILYMYTLVGFVCAVNRKANAMNVRWRRQENKPSERIKLASYAQ